MDSTINNHRQKKLIIHFTIYIIINMGLMIVNLFTSPQYIWFYWPLLGWGIGLIIHSIFGVLLPLRKMDLHSKISKN